jgi:hypothetical protein
MPAQPGPPHKGNDSNIPDTSRGVVIAYPENLFYLTTNNLTAGQNIITGIDVVNR